jgi:acetyltransferase EpsM
MKRLILVGCNHETLVLARKHDFHPVAVAEVNATESERHGLPVYSSDADAVNDGADGVILAIDRPDHRRRAYETYRDSGIEIVSLIDGNVGPNTRFGSGLVKQVMTNLSVDCVLGKAARLNTGANVMHDVELGDFVTIAPNAVLLSGVKVGALTYIGANATILPNCSIGEGCMVGAGAVVTDDVIDGATVKGAPAR